VQQGGKLRTRHADRAKTEPRGLVGLREAPAHLNDEQREIWARLAECSPIGLLERTDSDIFEGYCVLLQARNQAARAFNKTDAAILIKSTPSRGAFISNPYLKEYRRLTELLRLLQGELGYTPAARTRIAVTPREDDDPLAPFLSKS
jgi:P27 family predicted phage terminase small subunit